MNKRQRKKWIKKNKTQLRFPTGTLTSDGAEIGTCTNITVTYSPAPPSNRMQRLVRSLNSDCKVSLTFKIIN